MSSTEAPRLKVVYILGSSRCGSTILDGILGTGDSALSTGELGHFFWAFDPAEPPPLWYCSCGLRVTACPVWSKVWSELATQYDMQALKRATKRFEDPLQSLPNLGLGRLFRTRGFREHLDSVAQFVRTVARIGGVRIVVDSSKEPSRGWLYSLLPQREFDVRFLHLVRDGRSVVSAMMGHYDPYTFDSGPSPRPWWEAAAFSTAHWLYMNTLSSLLGALNKSRYLRVRYEDLVSDPMETLASIESFLGADLSESRRRIAAGLPLASGHLLCGNRSKASPVLKVKPREATVEALPLGPSLVFLSLAGWLQWLYQRPRAPKRPFRPAVLTETYPGVPPDR